MKCADIMTLNPKMCVPEDKVDVAISIMWDYDCGVVPVVKDPESKELIGIVTDRDIAMHVVRHACAHPLDVKVSECMSFNAFACQLDAPVEEIIQMMAENKVRRIPVVDQNCCVGIVSQADLLRHAKDLELPIVSMLQQISIPCVEKANADTACADKEKNKE